MSSGIAGEEQRIALTLFTDASVIRGFLNTRHRRVTDILNEVGTDFIVLHDVLLDEFGARAVAQKAEYAQVNLASVLFAVGDSVEADPELRTEKVVEQAMISIPPFRIIGTIHLLPDRDMRGALEELTGRFIPVTNARYWSDTVGESQTNTPVVAVNHALAQIMAPHREVDPWAGLAPSAGVGETQPDATPVQDPWGQGVAPQPAQDPWGDGGSNR